MKDREIILYGLINERVEIILKRYREYKISIHDWRSCCCPEPYGGDFCAGTLGDQDIAVIIEHPIDYRKNICIIIEDTCIGSTYSVFGRNTVVHLEEQFEYEDMIKVVDKLVVLWNIHKN